jgi:hypothetical protein
MFPICNTAFLCPQSKQIVGFVTCFTFHNTLEGDSTKHRLDVPHSHDDDDSFRIVDDSTSLRVVFLCFLFTPDSAVVSKKLHSLRWRALVGLHALAVQTKNTPSTKTRLSAFMNVAKHSCSYFNKIDEDDRVY